MKNILITTDFSDLSKNAIQYALDFFSDEICTFYLMHVVASNSYLLDDFYTAADEDSLETIVFGDQKERLTTLLEETKRKKVNPNFSFKAITDFDILKKGIQEACDTFEIDLVIQGSDGKSSLGEKFFGAHSTRLIRESKTPVLIIPELTKYKPIQKVVLGIDQDRNYVPQIPIFIKWLFESSKINQLIILNFNDDPNLDHAENWKNELVQFNPSVKYISTEDVEEAIRICQEVLNAELSLVLTSAKPIFERILSGSTIAGLVEKSKIPVLFIPEN